MKRFIHPTAKIYENVKISERTELTMKKNTFIGDFCFISCKKLVMKNGSQINSGSRLIGMSTITLEENVVVSYGCTLLSSTDTPKGKFMNDASPLEKRHVITGDITIGRNSFIGAHCVVMPNVKVGENSVVGALTYLDKNVPSNCVVYSKPQHIQRKRTGLVSYEI